MSNPFRVILSIMHMIDDSESIPSASHWNSIPTLSYICAAAYSYTMSHYDVFRHHLAIKFPAYGHALWEPDPGNLYPAVEIGDVGYIFEGRFHRLFNVLLPAEHPTHHNFGVPEYHKQLTLNMDGHILIGRLSTNNFCSAKVTSIPVSGWVTE